MSRLLFGIVLLIGVVARAQNEEEIYRLPDDFLVGAGVSAYQTEGAWNTDGKGQSFLDYVFQLINRDGNHENMTGNIAADGYHHVQDDVKLLTDLKMNAYRFSLSWTRILPNGYDSDVNMAGVEHYKNLISELRKNNITPVVTLMHFDYPKNEQFSSDFLSEDMPELFANYSRVAFRELGDQVKYWTTINEPDMFCTYMVRRFAAATAPASTEDTTYDCLRISLLAHGKAYQVYQNEFKESQGGQVGWSILPLYARPNSSSEEDVQAANRYNSFAFGLWLDPLVKGDFSPLIIETVERKSTEEGRNSSRLPTLSLEEKQMLNGSIDFLGLNIYFGNTVSNAGAGAGSPSSIIESDADVVRAGGAFTGGFFQTAFQRIDDWAMSETLLWARDHYPGKPIMVTENGYEMTEKTLEDPLRQVFYSKYMRALTKTVHENNVTVLGLFAWSLIDGFEWSRGYTSKMGLASVDFTSPGRERHLRDSSAFFQKLMTDRIVPLVSNESEAINLPTTSGPHSTEPAPTAPHVTGRTTPAQPDQTTSSSGATTVAIRSTTVFAFWVPMTLTIKLFF